MIVTTSFLCPVEDDLICGSDGEVGMSMPGTASLFSDPWKRVSSLAETFWATALDDADKSTLCGSSGRDMATVDTDMQEGVAE